MEVKVHLLESYKIRLRFFLNFFLVHNTFNPHLRLLENPNVSRVDASAQVISKILPEYTIHLFRKLDYIKVLMQGKLIAVA